MSSIEEKVTIYTCDAPECDTQAVVRETDDLPAGFFGTTKFTYNGGGSEEEWFACTALHIRKAVVAVQEANGATNPALPKVKAGVAVQEANGATNPALPKVKAGTPAGDVEDTGTTRS